MNKVTIYNQIKSLETQIRVLKAQLSVPDTPLTKERKFSELYGIICNKSDSTQEEIDSVKYQFYWE